MLTVCWKPKARQQAGSQVGHRGEYNRVCLSTKCFIFSASFSGSKMFFSLTCDGMARIWSMPSPYILAKALATQRNVLPASSPVFQPLSSDVDLCCCISLIKPGWLCSWRILEEAAELGWCSLYLQEHQRPPVMRAHSACLFIFRQGASAIFPTLSPTRERPGQEADAWESWFSPAQGACCSGGCSCHRPTHKRRLGIWRGPHYEASLACQRHRQGTSDLAS